MTDSESRYAFSCPNCAGSFSISIDRIPPVRARFSCPKCGKAMDFPSRDEARVYIRLQSTPNAPAEAEAPAAPALPGRPTTPGPASPDAEPVPSSASTDQRYRVEKAGFEKDSYDRRAMRNLIRTGGIDEFDRVSLGGGEPSRAGDMPELRSLFGLRKSARIVPPAVCRKHTDLVAHYTCLDSGRPLCEDCAPEKKFGGASVRVCDHCGGTVRALVTELES